MRHLRYGLARVERGRAERTEEAAATAAGQFDLAGERVDPGVRGAHQVDAGVAAAGDEDQVAVAELGVAVAEAVGPRQGFLHRPQPSRGVVGLEPVRVACERARVQDQHLEAALRAGRQRLHEALAADRDHVLGGVGARRLGFEGRSFAADQRVVAVVVEEEVVVDQAAVGDRRVRRRELHRPVAAVAGLKDGGEGAAPDGGRGRPPFPWLHVAAERVADPGRGLDGGVGAGQVDGDRDRRPLALREGGQVLVHRFDAAGEQGVFGFARMFGCLRAAVGLVGDQAEVTAVEDHDLQPLAGFARIEGFDRAPQRHAPSVAAAGAGDEPHRRRGVDSDADEVPAVLAAGADDGEPQAHLASAPGAQRRRRRVALREPDPAAPGAADRPGPAGDRPAVAQAPHRSERAGFGAVERDAVAAGGDDVEPGGGQRPGRADAEADDAVPAPASRAAGDAEPVETEAQAMVGRGAQPAHAAPAARHLARDPLPVEEDREAPRAARPQLDLERSRRQPRSRPRSEHPGLAAARARRPPIPGRARRRRAQQGAEQHQAQTNSGNPGQ